MDQLTEMIVFDFAIRRAKGRNRFGWNFREFRGPCSIFGLPVGLAKQVGQELFEPDRVALNEVFVVKLFCNQRMGKRQHDRRVGIGARCQPFGFAFGGHIFAQRTNVDKFNACCFCCQHVISCGMAAQTAQSNVRILERRTSKKNGQLGVLCNILPRRHFDHQPPHVGHNVVHEGMGRRQRVRTER